MSLSAGGDHGDLDRLVIFKFLISRKGKVLLTSAKSPVAEPMLGDAGIVSGREENNK